MEENKKIKTAYTSSVGRRREAIARVRLYKTIPSGFTIGEKIVKKGEIYVNEILISEYFSGKVFENKYTLPFRITNTIGKFTVTVKVSGGGKSGQLDAFKHAVARALIREDRETYQSILKKHKLLTRDSRARERRKVGMGGKARRKKQSPKR